MMKQCVKPDLYFKIGCCGQIYPLIQAWIVSKTSHVLDRFNILRKAAFNCLGVVLGEFKTVRAVSWILFSFSSVVGSGVRRCDCIIFKSLNNSLSLS